VALIKPAVGLGEFPEAADSQVCVLPFPSSSSSVSISFYFFKLTEKNILILFTSDRIRILSSLLRSKEIDCSGNTPSK